MIATSIACLALGLALAAGIAVETFWNVKP